MLHTEEEGTQDLITIACLRIANVHSGPRGTTAGEMLEEQGVAGAPMQHPADDRPIAGLGDGDLAPGFPIGSGVVDGSCGGT